MPLELRFHCWLAATVAVPDLHPGARGRGVARDVEALVAVDLQLAVGQAGPLLVRRRRCSPRSAAACRWSWPALARPGTGSSPRRAGPRPYRRHRRPPPALLVRPQPYWSRSSPDWLVMLSERLVPLPFSDVIAQDAFSQGPGPSVWVACLTPSPQDRAHAQAAHGIGDRVEVGDVVGAVLGAVVVDAGVHRDAELGQHGAAGVAAQVVLEVGDPARLGGVRVAEHAVDVDRQQGAAQARVGTLGAQVVVRVRPGNDHPAPGQAGVARQPAGLEVGQVRGAVGPGLVHDVEVEVAVPAVLVDHGVPHLVEGRGVADRAVLQPRRDDDVHAQRGGRVQGRRVAVPPRSTTWSPR